MATADVASLVEALPELYQPVYGHPEFDGGAMRPSAQRDELIVRTISRLAAQLGRPARVLDLGCAQGYLSFALAAQGAVVTGVDRGAENIALCQALAAEHPALRATFVQADAVDCLASLAAGQYDLVLALSVTHHVAHERGADVALEHVRRLSDKVEAVLAETALPSEPVYWAAAQPADPRAYFTTFAFVHVLGRHGTHLSDVVRPLWFASSHLWLLGDDVARFERWTTEAHEGAGDIHRGSRRYYFSADRMAKYFAFDHPSGERNRAELAGEAAFLSAPPQGLPRLPRLHGHGIADDHGWLVRDCLPGRLLSTLLATGEAVDRVRVVADVLDELCGLEAAGLYHADVRLWNVLVDESGRSTLIDYGDINPNPLDCATPRNVFLSFLVFVQELHADTPPRLVPERPPLVSPGHFEGPLQPWIRMLWQEPLGRWTFARMRELLAGVLAEGQAADLAAPVVPARHAMSWEAALESHLDVLGRYQASLGERLDRGVTTLLRRDELLHELLAQASAARSERLEQQRQLEAARAAMQAATAEVEALRAANAAAEREAAASRTALAQESARLAQREAEMEALGRERAIEQEARLVEQSAHRAEAAAHLAASRAQAARVAELEQARSSADAQIAELAQAHERQRIEADRWWRSTAELTRELELAYGTLSWRITAPLRSVKAWLRGLMPAGQTSPAPGRRAIRRAADFVHARPALRSWIGGRLERYPRLKQRVKRAASEAAHTPAAVDGTAAGNAPDAAGLPRTTAQVYAELDRALAERSDEARDPPR